MPESTKGIPQSRLVYCMHCGTELDSADRNTYRRGTAWFKNRSSKSGGTHGATLMEWSGYYACRWCIEKVQHGIPINQMRLFDVETMEPES